MSSQQELTPREETTLLYTARDYLEGVVFLGNDTVFLQEVEDSLDVLSAHPLDLLDILIGGSALDLLRLLGGPEVTVRLLQAAISLASEVKEDDELPEEWDVAPC